MRNLKFIAFIIVAILYGSAIITSHYFPLALSQRIEKYIGIAVLIMVIVYLVTLFWRTKGRQQEENNKKSKWLLLLSLLCLGVAFISMPLVPILFTNIDAKAAMFIYIGFLILTFVGAVLLVQWLISKH